MRDFGGYRITRYPALLAVLSRARVWGALIRQRPAGGSLCLSSALLSVLAHGESVTRPNTSTLRHVICRPMPGRVDGLSDGDGVEKAGVGCTFFTY